MYLANLVFTDMNVLIYASLFVFVVFLLFSVITRRVPSRRKIQNSQKPLLAIIAKYGVKFENELDCIKPCFDVYERNSIMN